MDLIFYIYTFQLDLYRLYRVTTVYIVFLDETSRTKEGINKQTAQIFFCTGVGRGTHGLADSSRGRPECAGLRRNHRGRATPQPGARFVKLSFTILSALESADCRNTVDTSC